MPNDKQSDEDVLIERAKKTITQILCDIEFFDQYKNTEERIEDFFLKHVEDIFNVLILKLISFQDFLQK